jgi:hypothetical protein
MMTTPIVRFSVTRLWCLIGLLPIVVFAYASAAADELTIIDLQQRPAQEMVPLIQPFLKPGDSLVGRDYSLFIRTDPGTLAQVRQMLASLDRPAVSVMISVRRGHQRQRYDNYQGPSAVVLDRDVNTDGGEVQRVRALSGEPVFIQTGISVVQPDYGVRVGRDGTRVYRSYGRQDLTGGVYATVQLQDNGRIRVELDSRGSHPREGRYGRIDAAVQNLSTVVTGRLGEWIPLGGVSRSYAGSGSALVSGGVGGGTADDSVYIKVDRVD